MVLGIVCCLLFLAFGPTLMGFVLVVMLCMMTGAVVSTIATRNSEHGMTDTLTGLWNRGGFDLYLSEEYNRQKRLDKPQPMSLLILDLDGFKSYNDTFGHPAGDQVLKAVSGVLLNCANRPADKVFRHGGDEFSVLLPDTDLSGCFHIAEEIRNSVKELNMECDHDGNVITVSIGGVTVDASESVPLTKVIEEADDNLYKSKNNGRDKVNAGSM